MVTLPLRRSSLYRKLTVAVICAAFVASAAIAAYAQRKRSHQLRAIALVELYGTSAKIAKPTGGRVLPIAILVGERWYDAATYNATPRPLALDEGTVYEALDNGDSAGFFTVNVARHDRGKGEWFGVGQWKSAADVARAEKAAAAAHREKTRTLADDGRPKLHKPKPGDSKSSDSKPGDSKPGDSKTGDAAPAPRPKSDQDHPLVVPEKGQPPRPAPPVAGSRDITSSDPDRPTLRRGGGEQVSATLEPPPASVAKTPTGSAPTLATRPGASRAGGPSQVFIAVSDPDGTGATRNFGFPWKPEEERALKAKTIALAEAEVAKYRAGRFGAVSPEPKKHAGRSAAKGSAKKPSAKNTPPAVHLENVQVTAYDLGLDNNAELVVTATSGDIFVTLVARTNLEFMPQKLFAVVTDKEHLDAIPRMELIGAIDADADAKGKGELLFRIIGDGIYRYALYRVSRDSMSELWQSGRYEF